MGILVIACSFDPWPRYQARKLKRATSVDTKDDDYDANVIIC